MIFPPLTALGFLLPALSARLFSVDTSFPVGSFPFLPGYADCWSHVVSVHHPRNALKHMGYPEAYTEGCWFVLISFSSQKFLLTTNTTLGIAVVLSAIALSLLVWDQCVNSLLFPVVHLSTVASLQFLPEEIALYTRRRYAALQHASHQLHSLKICSFV